MAKKVASLDEHKALALGQAKLATSGLTLDDAKLLGIFCLSPQETHALHKTFKPLCSLKIEYFDHLGHPLADWPAAPPFFRIRYLEEPNDFSKLTEKKSVRYVQLPNTVPVAYFPRNQDWSSIVRDPDQPIIITEGELKSAKACKEGFPTIGLGGVWNWRAVKTGVEWLPSLSTVVWLRRHVYICFDSDYQKNPNICLALRELAAKLEELGAYTHMILMPPAANDSTKTGLDDLLVAPGGKAHFEQLLAEAPPLGLFKPLWELNDSYVSVKDPGMVIDQETFARWSHGVFKDIAAEMTFQEQQIKADGTITYKKVAAVPIWLKWPLRTRVEKLTYKPGADKFVDIGRGRFEFNKWPGWGVEPEPGDTSLFMQLIDHIFSEADPASKHWFLQWCAFPLQYPGSKLFSSAVVHGVRHGTGKSLLGYTLGRIYGKNFTEISQMDLHNSFNEWAEGKQFVMGDDVTGSDRRADADFLKKLITQREIRVNAKFLPTYVVPDCINYFFTANHPDAFFLEDDDRRFFIHEVVVEPLSEEFYAEYDLWLDTGGSAAVFDLLLHYDTSDFNPAAPAMWTAAKERMIEDVRSDLASWVRQLLAAPDQVLRFGEIAIKKDLFTNKELLQLYDPDGRTRTTANGLGRELSRAKVRQVNDGRPVRTKDGLARYYAVRNRDKWRHASYDVVIDHLKSHDQPNQPKY